MAVFLALDLLHLLRHLTKLDRLQEQLRTMPISYRQFPVLDPMDSTSANVDVPNFVESLTGDIKGLKIAVPKEYLGEGVSEAVRQSVLDALKVLEGRGGVGRSIITTF